MTRRSQKRAGLASLLLLVLLVAALGCSGQKSSTPPGASTPAPTTPAATPTPAPKEPAKQAVTQVVIAQSADAITLDPQKQSDTNTGNVVHNIFDALLLRAPDMSVQPALATEYKRLSDTEWEFKLRQGVKFHNGEAFNADSVKYTVERVKNPATKALQAGNFSTITKVEVVDPYTVKFTTAAWDPLFLARMTNLLVVPPGYIKEKGDDHFAKNPVGTGPYKFVEWVKDDRVVVEADATHWRGKPAIPKVIWKPVPEMATRIAGLQGGQIDVVSAVPADQIKNLEGSKNLKVVTTKSAQIQMLNFNPAAPPADKKEFRLAVAHAINPKPIMEALLGAYASPIELPLSTVIPPRPTGVQPITHDLAKAKEYMAKAGLSGGVTIDFISQNNTYPLDKDIAQALAQQLKAIGITANVKPIEYSQFLDLLKAKKQSPVFLMGGNNIWFDTDPQINAFYGGKGVLSVWNDPELDKLILAGRASKDEKERVGIYKQAFERIRDEVAGLPILQYVLVSVHSSRVEWSPRPDGRIRILEISPK